MRKRRAICIWGSIIRADGGMKGEKGEIFGGWKLWEGKAMSVETNLEAMYEGFMAPSVTWTKIKDKNNGNFADVFWNTLVSFGHEE